jgi:proteasome lid subunit RPN8/RPN11
VTRAAVRAMVAHARERVPAECCGVLVGRGSHVVEAARARNLAASPTRYLLDPADHMNIRRSARQRGFEVLGFYHSHPHGPATPSETDLAEAAYPEAVLMIVGLTEHEAELRAYRLEGGAFAEVPWVEGDVRPAP